jgi:hypothetical protein
LGLGEGYRKPAQETYRLRRERNEKTSMPNWPQSAERL